MSTDEQPGAMFEGLRTPPCAQTLGAKLLEADPEGGRVVMEFHGKQEFLNPAGLVQGGFLAAMLDDTMGLAGALASGRELFTTTISMNVSYTAPAKPGKLIGRGEVLQMGKTIAFLQATLEDEQGRIVARATASARLVKGVFD